MEKLIIPFGFSYDYNGAINERMIIKENEIIVIIRNDGNLLKNKYNMIKKANYYTLSVAKNRVKDTACNIIIDFFKIDRGVLLIFDDSNVELIEEIITSVKSGNYKKEIHKYITPVIEKSCIGDDIYIHVGRPTNKNPELIGMKEEALKIPTAQSGDIDGEYVIVNPSQYRKIKEFALRNEYVIDEKAKSILDRWEELQQKAEVISL